MLITVNGEKREFSDGFTVLELLGALDLEPRKIAVERNREIVPRSVFDALVLADGDQIEIVQFVGGG